MRREAATETRPALLERYHADVAVLVVSEVVDPGVELGASIRKPTRMLYFVGPDRLRGSVLAEDRRPPEAPRTTVGTGRNFVTLVESDCEPAGLAPERASACESPGYEGVECLFLRPDRANDNELIRP